MSIITRFKLSKNLIEQLPNTSDEEKELLQDAVFQSTELDDWNTYELDTEKITLIDVSEWSKDDDKQQLGKAVNFEEVIWIDKQGAYVFMINGRAGDKSFNYLIEYKGQKINKVYRLNDKQALKRYFNH